MPDARTVYGTSLGRYGNFSARTDGLFTSGDTTPDVSLGTLFYTNNTSATAITYFDGIQQGGLIGPEEGKQIKIIFLDTATTLVNGNRMLLSDTANTFPANSSIELMYHNSSWYEQGRSRNVPITTQIFQPAVTAVAGSFGVNVTNVKQLVIANSAAGDVLVSFSGGDIGQSVYVVPNTTNALFVANAPAGNIVFPGTNTFLLSASAAYQFQRVVGGNWRFIKDAVIP